MMIDIS